MNNACMLARTLMNRIWAYGPSPFQSCYVKDPTRGKYIASGSGNILAFNPFVSKLRLCLNFGFEGYFESTWPQTPLTTFCLRPTLPLVGISLQHSTFNSSPQLNNRGGFGVSNNQSSMLIEVRLRDPVLSIQAQQTLTITYLDKTSGTLTEGDKDQTKVNHW